MPLTMGAITKRIGELYSEADRAERVGDHARAVELRKKASDMAGEIESALKETDDASLHSGSWPQRRPRRQA